MKFIAFDLEGVFIRRSAGHLAHKEWFRRVGDLSDKEIENIDNEDYFDHVFTLMEEKTDLDRNKEKDRKLMTKLARSLFQEIYLHHIQKLKGRIEIHETIEFARSLKGYKLALITTTPDDIVKSILKIIDCEDLFDVIVASPLEHKPNKRRLFEMFIKDHGKPMIYFCDRKGDVAACKKLGIKSALVMLDIYDDAKADFRVKSKKDMEEVLKGNL